jgi:hypothetical protein
MRWSALALVAAVTALGILSSPAAAWPLNDCDVYYPSCRGSVIPCSLDGVNPVHHPSIFGNPALAYRLYGFIRSPDGTWHVENHCVRGLNHN